MNGTGESDCRLNFGHFSGAWKRLVLQKTGGPMSATWTSLQSVIQLGVAINAAIFSVAALRGPLVARERDATDSLLRLHGRLLGNTTVTADPKWKSFHSLAIQHQRRFRREREVDRTLGQVDSRNRRGSSCGEHGCTRHVGLSSGKGDRTSRSRRTGGLDRVAFPVRDHFQCLFCQEKIGSSKAPSL